MFALDIGAGTPVVLLHGFGLDHRSLMPLEPVFEASGGWRRIHLDLPGATGTPIGAIASTQDLADAVLDEITRRLGTQQRFALVGGSFGGMIARFVAHERRDQVAGLATLAGVFVAERERRTVPSRIVLRSDPRIEPILADALEPYRADAVVESVDDARAFLQHVLPGIEGADQDGLARVAARYRLDVEPEDLHPEPFLQPCLHVTGRQDDVVGYSDAWQRIDHYPRATFASLDAAGHNLLFEQSTLCAALLTDWLSRVRQHG